MAGPKVLLFDIETAPLLGYVWGLFDQNVGLNQIKQDWCVIAWAAKWLGEPASKIKYKDLRDSKNMEDDKELLKDIWELLDEADLVITQNGKSFDSKKLNARFIINGMQPPSAYRHLDTKIIAKRYFSFTSNKLEYMTDKLCTKYKKLSHKKFPGFELWKECLKGNIEAWKEMEKYNKHDVLSLEELYNKLAPWDNTISFSAYSEDPEFRCNCGSDQFMNYGFAYSNGGKYQRYKCKNCGAGSRGRKNLMSTEKRAFVKPRV